MDWIIEGIRWLSWSLTSGVLTLMDIAYKFCESMAKADFLKSDVVWEWYYVLMMLLGTFIVFRVFSIYFKFIFNEEYRDKISINDFINKLIAIAIVSAMLPMLIGFISGASTLAIDNINVLVGTPSNSEPSTFIISSFLNQDNGYFDESGNWIETNKVTYTIEDVDINKSGENGDDYFFFNNASDLFILVIIGLVAAVLLIVNSIQIGRRMYSLVLKILLSPIPISSLIVPGDDTFSNWRKMIISDYVLNFFQTLMIIIVMTLSSSKMIQNMGIWVQLLSFISGLSLLVSGVPEIARIIGGDTSQGSMIQQIASFRMATKGIGSALRGGVGIVGNGLSTATSLSAYSIGRTLGGKSISNTLSNNKNSTSNNGFMGGNAKSNDSNNKYSSNRSYGTSQSNNSSYSNNENNSKFNSSSKNDFNNTPYNNATNEFTGDNSIPSTFNSNIGLKEDKLNTNSSNGFINKNNINNGNDLQKQKSNTQTDNPNRLSKPNSVARKITDTANSINGPVGFTSRLAVNSSKHLYANSMNKLQSNKLYKVGSNINSLGKKEQINEK